MNERNVEKLMADSEFNEKLTAAKNEAEVKKLFAENGIEADIVDGQEGEFEEAELENVVGGASRQNKFFRVKINGKYITVQIRSPFGNFSVSNGGGGNFTGGGNFSGGGGGGGGRRF